MRMKDAERKSSSTPKYDELHSGSLFEKPEPVSLG